MSGKRDLLAGMAVACLVAGCSPYGMQGSPAAVQAGAAVGGVLGAIVGDRAGGYNGSQFGALLGTVAGAAVGNAVTTPRAAREEPEEEYRVEGGTARRYVQTEESDLRIENLRFIDGNRDHCIDAEEEGKLVFDLVNGGDLPAYNVTPVVEETSGMKHLVISPSAQVAYMPSGNRIRYTATIRGERRLKTGQAAFRVYAVESDGGTTEVHEFSLPTRRRTK